MKIAIIIPAYNENENISKLVKKILSIRKDVKIFIIDDSLEKNNDENLLENRKVSYFHRKKKLGRGSAVLLGLKKALKFKNFELFIEMDADFSHNPNELNSKIVFFKKNNLDLLIASRYKKNSKIINWSLGRLFFSKISNFLAKKLLKIPTSDYTNGFRFYSKRSVKKIIKKCGKIGDGFIVLSEVLLTIHLSNFKISEKSTIFVNRVRGESSVNLGLIIKSFYGLIKLYLIKKFYE